MAADPPILLMDEPFSAVDPVVREELQTEILRLQSELRKTIVFVTHDIDEALKLGDKVAVFGRGGVLQQYDEPSRLLSNPANDFVAGFIGADRGYRGLQFRHATGLAAARHSNASRRPTSMRWTSGPGEWALVTKPDGTPYAWINADGSGCTARESRCTTAPTAAVRCSIPTAALRLALDAALSSPAGLGVAVDGERQVIGGVHADDVLRRASNGRSGSEPERAERAVSAHPPRRRPGTLTLIHLWLSLIPLVLGLLIAVPLGALVQRTRCFAGSRRWWRASSSPSRRWRCSSCFR